MGRFLLSLVVVGAACLVAHAQTPIWVTPDVPTDETLSGNQMLPWEIWKYDGTGYTLALAVPGRPDLNAIHKMDVAGDWLFSVEAPSDLGGSLLPPGSIAEARDIIWYDASLGSYKLCMAGTAVGIPPGSVIDAIHMDGGDAGDLIVSFDVPTDVTGFPGTFEPADLVRFGASGIGVCTGYAIVAANPDFPAAAAGAGVPVSTNVDGADGIPNVRRLFPFDIPTDIPPTFVGGSAFIPGQIAEWDAAVGTWQLHLTLGGWPISSIVDGLSCGGTTAGRVDPRTMKMDKLAPGSVKLTWPGSCAAGAQDYGIYRGTLGNWTSHTQVVCHDAPPLLSESAPTGTGDDYFLVVPQNECNGSEGSYGRCSPGHCLAGDERSAGIVVCEPILLLPTPPACL